MKTFQYEGGLVEYVKYLTRENELLHPEPISVKRTVDGVEVELAMQWVTDSYSDTLLGYANSIRTVDGGTHVDGLKTALTRTVNTLARKFKHIKEADSNFTGENIREGLSCIVSVKVPSTYQAHLCTSYLLHRFCYTEEKLKRKVQLVRF